MTFKELCETGFLDIQAYSGRNMYGKKCVGIVTREGESVGMILASLIESAMEEPEALQIVIKGIRTMRTDSFGLDTIVYFPSALWNE